MTKLSENMAIGFVLCAIESRVWTGARTDSVTSAEVTEQKGAESDAGKFVKVLVKSSALRNIQNAVNKARAGLYAASVPWLASSHLVKIERMGELDSMIREQKTAFDEAVTKFLDQYPELVAGAEKRLGKLFDKGDYPSADALKNKFSFSITWLPFTQAPDDVLNAINSEAARMIENSVEEAVKRGRGEAHSMIITRTLEAVRGVIGALENYTKASDDGKRAVLHESRIEKLVTGAADLLDYSFPDSDAERDAIAKIADLMNDVALEGADTFKENAAARAKAIVDLGQIVKAIEAL